MKSVVPLPGVDFDLERSVHQSEALTNAEQTKALGRSGVETGIAGVEAAAIVVDDHRDEPVVGPENHTDARGSGMAHDVGQRLLQNTVQSGLDIRGQAFVVQCKMQVELDGGAFAPGLQKIFIAV